MILGRITAMKRLLVLLGVLLFSLICLSTADAHGVKIAYTTTTAVVVKLQAHFDSGEPMTGGQVTIYAPDNPSSPWLTGTCDEQGRFQFTPDPAIPGTWEVQVRLAGHGDIVYVPIGAADHATAPSGTVTQIMSDSSYSPLQLVVMGGSVVWGLFGTALFFSNRRA